MSGTVALYGAGGYAGRLAAGALADAGLEPLLGGRDSASLQAAESDLGLPVFVAGLEDSGSLDAFLEGAAVLLNCAGPFGGTQRPLVDACLRSGVHYLDLAGEVPEYAALEARGAEARRAGVMLLPGAGFGCVPTDCLAAHVASRVPEAERLEIAFKTEGGVSRGTAQTLFGSLHEPGVVRSGGSLVPARPAEWSKQVDFGDGDGPTKVVSNPWRGDLVTTGTSTQVDEVIAYSSFPAPVRALMRHGGRFAPILRSRAWQGLLSAATGRMPDGPDEAALDAGRTACWARATAADGRSGTSVLTGPDAYRFTALAATLCVERVLAGQAPPGYATPATAFGADAVLEITGVSRSDLDR